MTFKNTYPVKGPLKLQHILSRVVKEAVVNHVFDTIIKGTTS